MQPRHHFFWFSVGFDFEMDPWLGDRLVLFLETCPFAGRQADGHHATSHQEHPQHWVLMPEAVSARALEEGRPMRLGLSAVWPALW